MKKFTVQIKDFDDDISTTATDDIIKAYEAFIQPAKHAHIIDSETGEIYALRDCDEGEYTARVVQEIGNDFLQSLYEAYEYGNTDFEIMEDFE